MKKSKSEVSTVLIVGSNQSETKSLRIKTKHLKRIRHYAVSLVITIIGLSGTIIFLSMENSRIEKEKTAYNLEIARLKKQIPMPKDTLEAINYIQRIEDKLKKINQYLIKRGIKGFSIDGVGGNNESESRFSPEETYAMYDERLKEILVGVAFTPMGYPSNYIVNSTFGYRGDPIRRGRVEFHAGLDFKGRKGDPVKSTADGKVIMAGWYQGYGKCVRIRHKNNLETLYGHLSKINVKEGQVVSTGQVIGNVGSTGYSTGNHLHYEVRKNGKPVNPKTYLNVH